MAPRVIWPLLVSVLLAGSALAQGPPADVFYSRQMVFRIPYQTDPGERRVKEVQLYVSTDQGRAWHAYANTALEQNYFKFTADRDGFYWFAVRTVDMEGRPFPPTVEGLRPGLKVIVDTQPPTVNLRALPTREGESGVEWDVRDDNLDLASLRLEYRLPGANEWQPLNGETPAVGQRYWKPGTNGNVEARLKARDRADNWNEAKVLLTPGGGSSGGFTGAASPPPRNDPVSNPPAGPPVHLVNNKKISLNYEIKEVGPSGVSVVELWYTTDGRNWQKYKEAARDQQPPMVIEVNGEGMYGFTLLVRSGVGLGDRPPQVGDAPQVWVEVDLTEPVVRMQSVEVGRGNDARNLTISWSATDKNLGRQPISLTYAEKVDGPWTPIAANVENTGRYVWQMPPGVPYKFLVRVQAADRAGNVGTAMLKDSANQPVSVIVDLAMPKVHILEVAPSVK